MPENERARSAGLDTASETGRYLFALSRPRFWLYLAGPVIVGVAFGAAHVTALFDRSALALLAYFLLPANVFLYGVNDVFDRRVDRENPKKASGVGDDAKEVRFEGQPAVVWAVTASAVLLGPVLVVVPARSWPWLAAWLLLATTYSAPPLRFKTTPVLDSVSNGLYVLPGAAAYAVVAGHQPPALAVAAGWLWTMGMHTFSAIPDVKPDRRAGIRTTATWLGADRSFWYCATVWALAALSFALLDWRLAIPLLVYPIIALYVRYAGVRVDHVYWWFPALNAVVGMALTLGGLWRLVHA